MLPTIDDGRHGQDNTFAVVDDRVHRLVFNNMKKVLQVIVCLSEQQHQNTWRTGFHSMRELILYLVEAHELDSSELFSLV